MVLIREHGMGDAAGRAKEVTRRQIGTGAAAREAAHSGGVAESVTNRRIVAMVKGRSRDRLYDS
jgi:hypothetical protein